MTTTKADELAAMNYAEAAKLLADELDYKYQRGIDPHYGEWREAVTLLHRLSAVEAERDALRAALADAAQSLETIAKNAGKKLDSEGQENMLAHHDQVRGYANSRAGAARAAMKGTT